MEKMEKMEKIDKVDPKFSRKLGNLYNYRAFYNRGKDIDIIITTKHKDIEYQSRIYYHILLNIVSFKSFLIPSFEFSFLKNLEDDKFLKIKIKMEAIATWIPQIIDRINNNENFLTLRINALMAKETALHTKYLRPKDFLKEIGGLNFDYSDMHFEIGPDDIESIVD